MITFDLIAVLYRLLAQKRKMLMISLVYAAVVLVFVVLLSKQEGERRELIRRTENVFYSDVVSVSRSKASGEKDWITETEVKELYHLKGIRFASPIVNMDVMILYQGGSITFPIQAVSDGVFSYIGITPDSINKDIFYMGGSAKKSASEKMRSDPSYWANLIVVFDVKEQQEYIAGSRLSPPKKYSVSVEDINENMSKYYEMPQVSNTSYVSLDMITALVKQGSLKEDSNIRYDEIKDEMLFKDIYVCAESVDDLSNTIASLEDKGYNAEPVVNVNNMARYDSMKDFLLPIMTVFLVIVSAILSVMFVSDVKNEKKGLIHKLKVLGLNNNPVVLALTGVNGLVACFGFLIAIFGLGIVKGVCYFIFSKVFYISLQYEFITVLVVLLVPITISELAAAFILKD